MILKQRLQQRQLAFYTSDDFLQHVFSRVEKLCKEEINKLKIKMESEKKISLKKSENSILAEPEGIKS